VLNKLKKIFMADKVMPRGKEWPDELQGVPVDEHSGVLPNDWVPAEELAPIDQDPGYLEHSAEAVGYGNRELQWNIYRSIANYIPEGDSVLDFGCARGDFKLFHATDFKFDIDYIGIDMNENLINAGKKVYEDKVDIRLQDWFSLPKDLKQDWSINIGSCNLRYDADIKTSDNDYLQNTIRTMLQHADKGAVILLTSSVTDIDDGLINYDPGLIFNWAQKEFGNVALDHTFSNDIFILVIYK